MNFQKVSKAVRYVLLVCFLFGLLSGMTGCAGLKALVNAYTIKGHWVYDGEGIDRKRVGCLAPGDECVIAAAPNRSVVLPEWLGNLVIDLIENNTDNQAIK